MKAKRLSLSVILLCLLATSAYAIQSAPASVTFLDSAGHQRIYVFAEGNNGHLVVNY